MTEPLPKYVRYGETTQRGRVKMDVDVRAFSRALAAHLGWPLRQQRAWRPGREPEWLILLPGSPGVALLLWWTQNDGRACIWGSVQGDENRHYDSTNMPYILVRVNHPLDEVVADIRKRLLPRITEGAAAARAYRAYQKALSEGYEGKLAEHLLDWLLARIER